MSTMVLIPGSFEGAWTYERVAAHLIENGHDVHTLTLSDLDGRRRGAPANLDDHVSDVVWFLVDNDLDDVIVCAHSYGGMVLRGVCDRVPQRCRGAIYIDAFLPGPGESCWTLLNEPLRAFFTALGAEDGRYLPPPPGSDPRAQPHPIASLLQASRAGEIQESVRHAYIHASAWRASPFRETYRRLQSDDGWFTCEIIENHEIMRNNPMRLAELLEKIIVEWA
jgi:pimeloyl-ACP methyl ester carboxylesterase